MTDEVEYHLLEEGVAGVDGRMDLESGMGAMLLESSGDPWVERGPPAVTGPWIPRPPPSIT